jgi:hypothetical protein
MERIACLPDSRRRGDCQAPVEPKRNASNSRR